MPPYVVAKGVNNLSKDDKLIKRMTAKPIPSDIEFKEFRQYLEMYGFKLDRTNGSHNIFIHPNSIDIYSIPTVNGIYNGGNSNLPLLGDNKTIAEFFRRPEGYRYALFDTMYDMVVCFVGTMLTTIVLGISYNFANAYKLDNLIKYQKQVVSTKI